MNDDKYRDIVPDAYDLFYMACHGHEIIDLTGEEPKKESKSKLDIEHYNYLWDLVENYLESATCSKCDRLYYYEDLTPVDSPDDHDFALCPDCLARL